MTPSTRDLAIHREALRLWWEREARIGSRFTRRAPDALDVATGVWGRVVAEAEQRITPEASTAMTDEK